MTRNTRISKIPENYNSNKKIRVKEDSEEKLQFKLPNKREIRENYNIYLKKDNEWENLRVGSGGNWAISYTE